MPDNAQPRDGGNRHFILLTRLTKEEVHPTFDIHKKAKDVTEKVRQYCPEVRWISNYATFGPWDYLDIFEAPDIETALRVACLVRYYGGAHTEVWNAVEWNSFAGNLRELAEVMEK